MKKTVKGDILKFSESGRLIDDLGLLQYLVIFRDEKGHRFHYTAKEAGIKYFPLYLEKRFQNRSINYSQKALKW